MLGTVIGHSLNTLFIVQCEAPHVLHAQSSFFLKHFDIDDDGFISFHEYLLIITLLSIPVKARQSSKMLHRHQEEHRELTRTCQKVHCRGMASAAPHHIGLLPLRLQRCTPPHAAASCVDAASRRDRQPAVTPHDCSVTFRTSAQDAETAFAMLDQDDSDTIDKVAVPSSVRCIA